MNEAWISPSAGCAVVMAVDGLFLLEACRPSLPQECLPVRFRNLLQLSPDIIQMPSGSFPFSEVQRSLDASWRIQSVLTMILTALDRDLPPSVRSEAAGVAKDLLTDEGTCQGLRHRLLAVPLPEMADVAGAPLGDVAARLIVEAQALRTLVVLANEAWEQTFSTSFVHSERQKLRRVCTFQGGFAALVDTLWMGDVSLFENWWTAQLREGQEDFTEMQASSLLPVWGDTALRLHTAAVAREVVRLLFEGDHLALDDLERSVGSLPLESTYELAKLRPQMSALSPRARIGLQAHVMATLEVRESSMGHVQAADSAKSNRKQILDKIDVGVAVCV